MSITKKKSDKYLLQFVSFLYQIGGWWFLLMQDAAALAFILFAVSLVLGLYALRIGKEDR